MPRAGEVQASCDLDRQVVVLEGGDDVGHKVPGVELDMEGLSLLHDDSKHGPGGILGGAEVILAVKMLFSLTIPRCRGI